MCFCKHHNKQYSLFIIILRALLYINVVHVMVCTVMMHTYTHHFTLLTDSYTWTSLWASQECCFRIFLSHEGLSGKLCTLDTSMNTLMHVKFRADKVSTFRTLICIIMYIVINISMLFLKETIYVVMRVVVKCYSLYVINWQPPLIIIMNISQVLFHKLLFPEG